MRDQWYVGVDIGGTTIKMAFITENGEIVDKWEIDTDKTEGGKHIPAQIGAVLQTKLVDHAQTIDRLKAMGVGAPAFMEMETGYVYDAVNIGWKNYPLKALLEQETGLPVAVDNDANVAALGEMWTGAGAGATELLCVTIGTGVGGGLISNGQIVHGVNGMAGEIGHITAIVENGTPCNCGKSGCLETVASATGITRLAHSELASHPESLLHAKWLQEGQISAKDVFEAAERNDAFAQFTVNKLAFYLGFSIANLANAINPEKIVIGGGVSKAGMTLLRPLREQFNRFALPRVANACDFEQAMLGNDAGVVGAAFIAKNVTPTTKSNHIV